jgi:hypothetical protein
MWQTALKLLAVYLLRNRMNQAKNNIQHDFSAAKENLASIAERHATQFKKDLAGEMGRISRSIVAFVFVILATVFAGLTALMWIFATAWTSPDRTLILSSIIVAGLVIAIGIACYISRQWKKKPLFKNTIALVESDWSIFKHGLEEDHKAQEASH